MTLVMNPMSAAALREAETPPQEWLVEDLIPRGKSVLFSAREKTGKGLFTIDLVCSVAEGSTFLGRPVKQGNAMYVATEESLADVKHRFGKRLPDDAHVPAFAVHLDGSYEGTLNIGNPDHIKEIGRVISEFDLSLLVLDVLCEMHTMDENSANEMGSVLKGLRTLAHNSNCAIVINHHMNKRNQARGSNGIAASVDIQIDYLADEDSDKLAGKLVAKGRGVPKARMGIEFDENSRWRQTSGLSSSEPQRMTQEARILDALGASASELTVAELSHLTSIPERSVGTVISKIKKTSPGILLESTGSGSGVPIRYRRNPQYAGHP